PSTAEVYVNDRLVRTEALAPGQFDLTRLPVATGRSDARVVVRDAFGGEREFSGAYYLTTSALARGLQEYSYAVGVERTNFGLENWTYGSPTAIARHRVGVTDSVTLGGRLEAASALVSGGPTLTARTPAGEVELAFAVSRAHGVDGQAASAAYAFVGRHLSLG